MDPEEKRLSHFVRIGKSLSEDNDANKRASSFVRIGKIPSSAFVRIGREPGQSADNSDFGSLDRMTRIGQSSFVRIGKREAVDDSAGHAVAETAAAASTGSQ